MCTGPQRQSVGTFSVPGCGQAKEVTGKFPREIWLPWKRKWCSKGTDRLAVEGHIPPTPRLCPQAERVSVRRPWKAWEVWPRGAAA